MMKKWKWASMLPRDSSTRAAEQNTRPPVTRNDAHRRWVTRCPTTRQNTGSTTASAISPDRVPEQEPHADQPGYVQQQHPLQEPVAPAPRPLVERVARGR